MEKYGDDRRTVERRRLFRDNTSLFLFNLIVKNYLILHIFLIINDDYSMFREVPGYYQQLAVWACGKFPPFICISIFGMTNRITDRCSKCYSCIERDVDPL